MKKSLIIGAAIAAALFLAVPMAAMADSTSSDGSQIVDGAIGTIIVDIISWFIGF